MIGNEIVLRFLYTCIYIRSILRWKNCTRAETLAQIPAQNRTNQQSNTPFFLQTCEITYVVDVMIMKICRWYSEDLKYCFPWKRETDIFLLDIDPWIACYLVQGREGSRCERCCVKLLKYIIHIVSNKSTRKRLTIGCCMYISLYLIGWTLLGLVIRVGDRGVKLLQ